MDTERRKQLVQLDKAIIGALEGKGIQWSRKTKPTIWIDSYEPSFDLECNWRVKPKPEYVYVNTWINYDGTQDSYSYESSSSAIKKAGSCTSNEYISVAVKTELFSE